MAYKVPNLEQQLGFLVALFKGLLPTRNVGSRFAPAWKYLKTIAGASTDVHAGLTSAVKDFMPDTAEKAALDRWLGLKAPGGSKLRKGATPARKAAAGRVRGANGSATVIGDQLIHRATGLLFQINKAGVIVAPVPGYLDLDIVAIDTGSKTRLEKGEVLEYLAPPAGIKTQVELQLALDEDGADQEQDGAARNRLLDAFSKPQAGGNQGDYVAWMLAQPGISQAFAYPNRAGIGTVDIIGLHSGTGVARILTGGELAALVTKIAALAPASVSGVGGSLRGLTAIAEVSNVELGITPNGDPQYAFDWDSKTFAPTVLTWQPAGVPRKLQFTTARPNTMKAGDRICIQGVASVQTCAPLKIEALSGADAVILEEVPAVAPAATDIVYAGGPLTAIIRDAILAHMNGDVLYTGSAGPLPAANAVRDGISTTKLEVLAAGMGTANPGGIYGSWSGGLLRGTLDTIAMYTRGVRNRNVVTPVADVEATNYAIPNDAQIGLITPGYVLVREI